MKYSEALVFRKQAAKSYDEYYDEYMNDQARQKLLNKGRVAAPTLLSLLGAIGGGMLGQGVRMRAGDLAGTDVKSLAPIGIGAMAGSALGGAAGRYIYGRQREVLEQLLRNEAWRYAAMRSNGRDVDPGKTLA